MIASHTAVEMPWYTGHVAVEPRAVSFVKIVVNGVSVWFAVAKSAGVALEALACWTHKHLSPESVLHPASVDERLLPDVVGLVGKT